jgi:hypothetical protein
MTEKSYRLRKENQIHSTAVVRNLWFAIVDSPGTCDVTFYGTEIMSTNRIITAMSKHVYFKHKINLFM